jgi:hypothetical protein
MIEAGWPGERASRSAIANRLRVALSTLRGFGLRDVLLTQTGGYLLDPAIPVVRARISSASFPEA